MVAPAVAPVVAPVAGTVGGVVPEEAVGFAPKRLGVEELAVVVVGAASDVVMVVGLAFDPEKRDGVGVVVDAGAALVVDAPPKSPPGLVVGAAAPPPPKSEGAAVGAG